MIQFFEIISQRFGGEQLTGKQKLVLIDLLEVGYGARLRMVLADYQSAYKEQQLKSRPLELYQLLEGQNVAIYKLRQAAESQAGIDNIPYGDPEA
ncbi:hypothetical protein [Hymenobacter terrenus]|uniref:hypothetical protein n=1 Tax=Hymenobacter terrenus TaxID=1629124 RepID=UPI000619BC46|nr:hypothetical protein [Hymenobacter terrenus]